ncbi:MAG: CoA transferase [Dehalococcoidales bacterium]|nr:CoA transferase [Dehalococcoidales bacterium]
MEQVLSGVKVLDLTHYLAGPYCTKMLADYGAEVLKIERPFTGDGARRLAPFYKDDPRPENSGYFMYLNTNKKGMTLDLKSETGKEIFRRLVKEADILVENFSPRVMPSLGLSYSVLEKINPELVMVSISNFGQTGPYRDYKATEIVEDAMGGWSLMVGHLDREPLKPGGNQSQFVAGLFAAIACVSAYYGALISGIGQQIDLSIQDAVLYIQMYPTSILEYDKVIRRRYGNRVGPFPSGILPCKDGYIGAIMVVADKWPVLCEWMGMPELINDPKFATSGARALNIDELDAIMMSWTMEHTQEELFREGQKRGLPFAIPASAKMLLESKHLNERHYFIEVDHPVTGKIKYPGPQIQMGDLPYTLNRAPLLGEHNEEILCGRLGYKKEDLMRLREMGVI